MSSDAASDSGASTEADATGRPRSTDPVHVEELLDDLESLAEDVESTAAHEEIHETRELLEEASDRGLIESRIRSFQPDDTAQALVGTIVFASPLLVEDGINDIAAFLFGFTVLGFPVFLLVNTLFVVFMTYALLEWTGRHKEEESHILRVVPTRLVMILLVSFLVSALLMTIWGRIDAWQEPVEALARINVLWTVGTLGAGLGDILSGDNAAGPE